MAAMDRFVDPDPNDDKPAAPAKPEKPAPAEDPENEMEEPAAPEGEKPPGEEGVKPAAEKPSKASPWKLVESYKKSNAQLQKEIAELRTAMKPGELPAEFKEKFDAIEARNKALEDEIRHVNYSKSKEFVDTYQKPYEEAWRSAIDDLKELTIVNDDGTSRAATAQDLIALANMPLGQARAAAKAWFGDSSDDVMAHRRIIRDLSEKQNRALDESKTKGGERDQQRAAEMQAKNKARAEEHSRVWKQVNDEATEKYEYLRPVEGQTERNERLEKATKFIDETFGLNVNQAKTQEERDQIIRRHAALRNRAIGFSVLKHENTALRSEVEALKKSLAEFQNSEPTGGDTRRSGNGEASADTLDGAVAGLAKYAN